MSEGKEGEEKAKPKEEKKPDTEEVGKLKFLFLV